MQLLSRYRTNESGFVAIESALTFPLLFITGFGLIDTSILMMQNHKLSAGLASAGNYLSQAPNPRDLEGKAKQLAVSGSFQPSSEPFIKGMNADVVSIIYRNVNNIEVNGSRDYRGGDVVSVVEIIASNPYRGLGILKTVTGGRLTVSARYEARLIGGQT